MNGRERRVVSMGGCSMEEELVHGFGKKGWQGVWNSLPHDALIHYSFKQHITCIYSFVST